MTTSEKHVQARSIATRESLIAATLDVIYDRGYNRATTSEFAKRAGVSRGALLHHFPTRSDIIVAAMERLLADGTHDIRSCAADVAKGKIRLGEFIEFLWGKFSGKFFYLSIEFINEARTDTELRQKMVPVVRQFHEVLDGIWAELQALNSNPQEARVVLNLTVCLVRGMGVQTVLKDDPAYYRALLEAWKNILPHLMSDLGHELMFPGRPLASPAPRSAEGRKS